MSHIFISYSRKDIDFARYFRAILENAGFAVWMDEKRLSAGMNWSDELQKAIDNCGAFVVIMSPDSHESKFVQSEILHALDRNKAMFPVLLIGEPFFLLKAYQYEDMRAGLGDKVSAEFIQSLQEVLGIAVSPQSNVRFEIVEANAFEFPCDVLILKAALGSSGLETQIAKTLNKHGANVELKAIENEGDFELVASEQAIAPRNCLFIRTASVYQFDYRHSREFANYAVSVLADEAPTTQHIAMTIHGVRTRRRLDEGETLLAQIAGFVDAIQSGNAPAQLRKITIVERDAARTQRLRTAVEAFFEEVSYAERAEDVEWAYDLSFEQESPVNTPDAGQDDVKPFALAIIPDDPDLEDIFYYGIQRPAHAVGLLCERIQATQEDSEVEEGLDSKLQRIGQATVVVFDISQISPMLYLKLGYAWGSGVPTALITQSEEQDFDKGHYIQYQKIWELEERLTQWLKQRMA